MKTTKKPAKAVSVFKNPPKPVVHRQTAKCGKCVYERFPGTTTKMVSSKLRQGMSSTEFVKVVKYVKVRCDKCYRVTWLPDDEVANADSPNKQIGQVFDLLERIATTAVRKEVKARKELDIEMHPNG